MGRNIARRVDEDELLNRERFHVEVLARSSGKCVICGERAVEAHHIMDRKLFKDGGYRLSNGAAVCNDCHWDCETTRVSVERVLSVCGLSKALLPESLSEGRVYDKWGNELLSDGSRVGGPLTQDDGMLKALAKIGVHPMGETPDGDKMFSPGYI